jgi:hypothetical protein
MKLYAVTYNDGQADPWPARLWYCQAYDLDHAWLLWYETPDGIQGANVLRIGRVRS